ncbi:MAG: hypothetical protein Q4Q07_02035 [Tissierellia bacterium]|nr:hypothetical protein [Tissierellia bacterium]
MRVNHKSSIMKKKKEDIDKLEKELQKLSMKTHNLQEKEEKFNKISREKLGVFNLEEVLKYKKELELPTGYLSTPGSQGIDRIFPSAFYKREQSNDPMNVSILNLFIEDNFQKTIFENILRYNGKLHKFYGLLNYMKRNHSPESWAFILKTNINQDLLQSFEKGKNPFEEEKMRLHRLEGYGNQIRNEMIHLYPLEVESLQRLPYIEDDDYKILKDENQREIASMSYLMSFFQDSLCPYNSTEVSKELDYEDVHISIRGILNKENKPFLIEIRQKEDIALAYFSLEGDLYSVLDTKTGETLYMKDEYQRSVSNPWAQMAEFAVQYCVSQDI